MIPIIGHCEPAQDPGKDPPPHRSWTGNPLTQLPEEREGTLGRKREDWSVAAVGTSPSLQIWGVLPRSTYPGLLPIPIINGEVLNLVICHCLRPVRPPTPCFIWCLAHGGLCISLLHLQRKQKPKRTSIYPKGVKVDRGQELHTSLYMTQQHSKLGYCQKAE